MYLYSKAGQDRWLDDKFYNKSGGFYIESGAFNGESLSNSLYFERHWGWGGLLIEPNPDNFKKVMYTHRNAFMINACISPSNKSETLTFTNIVNHPYLSRLETDFKRYEGLIRDYASDIKTEDQVTQCFPLYSILASIGLPHVDFLSLDIEGAEYHVLSEAPLDKLNIDLLLVEMGEGKGRTEKVQRFTKLMKPYGYLTQEVGTDLDVAFTKF